MAEAALARADTPALSAPVERQSTLHVTPWADLIMAVIGLRLLVSLVGAGVVLLLPQAHQSHGLSQLLLDPWRHFDAIWFTQIAAQGYGSNPLTTAYMPVYPLLIHVVAILTGGHYLLAALIVSNLSLALAVGLLWRWVAETFNPRVAWRTIALILLFPDGFFLVGAYSESTFLALAAGCLLALRRERPLLAGTLALLATLTRLQGLVLIVPILLALWPYRAMPRRPAVGLNASNETQRHTSAPLLLQSPPSLPSGDPPQWVGSRKFGAHTSWQHVVGAALPALGFAIYQRLLTAQLHGSGVLDTYRNQWHIPLQAPWQTIWQYVTVIRSPQWHLIHSPQYNYIILWYLLIALFSLGALLASWRRLGWQLAIFGLAGWCFLMTRWYSTGRYMLSVLPFFIALALWADGRQRMRWLTTGSVLLLVFFTAEFVQNSWVD